MKRIKSNESNATDSNSSVEAVLSRLPLCAPSQSLDDRVGEIFCASVLPTGPAAKADRRFGWPYLISIAIAASLIGFLLGRTNVQRSVDSMVAKNLAHDGASPNIQSNIKPVNFNVAAFEMLHGHSQQDGFQDCQTCHVAGKDEAFDGWFYGDSFFIGQHASFAKEKCSQCHLKADDLEVEDLFRGAHDFEGVAKCSQCHVLGKG